MVLSLLGMYKYDNALFEKLQLPGTVDRVQFINNLLAETAELEILYPDIDFMKNIIGAWSAKEFPVWEKLEKTLKFEYDPICNFDRTEEWEETGNALEKVAGFNSENLVNSSGADTKAGRKGRVKGNIGVTTTQQMITEERQVAKFNLTNYIIQEFIKRFCILIY